MSAQAYIQNGVERRRRLFDPPNAVVDRGIDLRRRSIPKPVSHVCQQAVPSTDHRWETQILKEDRHKHWPDFNERAQRELAQISFLPGITIKKVKRAVAQHYGVTIGDIEGRSRHAHVTKVRQVAAYVTKLLTGRSLPEIGRHFGGRDHTTILHAVNKITRLRDRDPELNAVIEGLVNRLSPPDRD